MSSENVTENSMNLDLSYDPEMLNLLKHDQLSSIIMHFGGVVHPYASSISKSLERTFIVH